MKRALLCFISILILSLFILGALYVKAKTDDGRIVSPLPGFLTRMKNNQVRFLDLWFPFIEQTYGNGLFGSELSAKSVLMYDMATNKTIFEKNARSRLPMASLTKIMTAIVSL